MAHRALIIQKVNKLRGGRKGTKKALNSQESSRQPVGRRASRRPPVVLEIIERPKWRRLVLRPSSDQAGVEWPGTRLGAKRGEKSHQESYGRRGARIAGLPTTLSSPDSDKEL